MPGTSCLTMIGLSWAEISRGGAAEAMTATIKTTHATNFVFTSLSEFPHRLLFGFLHHVGQSYCRSTLPFAYIGGFHECEKLDRLLTFDRWLAGFEKRCDLLDEGLVAFVFAGLGNSVFAEDGC